MLFKLFTVGLTVQEFDNIYNEMAKKYEKYEIKRLSCKQKENIKREQDGAGRPFKRDVKKQIPNAFSVLCCMIILFVVCYRFVNKDITEIVKSNWYCYTQIMFLTIFRIMQQSTFSVLSSLHNLR